jgi:hypothetical protein
MNKNSSIALRLTLAIALTTGTVLVKHPPATGNKAPGAYSDIMIAADETKREAQAGEKAAVPTDVQQSGGDSTGTSTPPDQGSQGDMNKGNPPR